MKSLPVSSFWCTRRFFTPLLAFLLIFSKSTFAQTGSLLDKKVNLHLNDATIKEALDDIGRQAGCTFSYSSTLLQTGKKVNIRQNDISVQDALKTILGTSLQKLQVQGDQIHIQTVEGGRKGNLRGMVETSDGQPGAFVNVSVKGTSKGAVTDESGQYLIKNVATGTQTVIAQLIGYASVESNIEIMDGETKEVPIIQLNEDSKVLHEVIVRATVNRFANKESDYIARLPIKNLENPQVYSSITKELMAEQVVTNINQALSNVPGSVANNDPAGGVGIGARGFGIGINARNGAASPTGRSTMDPVNVERIEVLKGPSATLFGNTVASYGGVINIVTKKPYERFGGEISYSSGSWELNRVVVDMNIPLNTEKTALFRINTAYNREGSFMETGHHNTIAIAPSFSYKTSKKLSFLVDVEYYSEDKTRNPFSNINNLINNFGLKNIKDIPIGYKTSLYGDDFSGKANTFRAVVTATYKLSENWTSTTIFSNSNTKAVASYQAYPNWLDQTHIVRGSSLFGPITDEYIDIQQNFNGDFKIGTIRNRVVFGLDYLNWSNKFSYTGGGIDTIDLVKGFSPVRRFQADKAIIDNSGYSSWSSASDTYSAYASDVVNLSKKLLAMLSLRLDRYQSKGGYGQTALAPKLGLVYQLIEDQVSVFGNYMSGFSNNGPITQPDGTKLDSKPSYAKQWEAGIKMNTFNKKLNGSISYYNINIADALRSDENNYVHQDGTQRSKGFDVELIANPVPGLNLVGGYTFNDNKYIRASSDEGKQVTGNPQNIANFWVSYKLLSSPSLKGVGLGLGGNYVEKSYFNSINTVIIPSYFLLNASVFYDHPKWRLGLKVNNLTNQKYWSAAVPQALRGVVGNVTFRF